MTVPPQPMARSVRMARPAPATSTDALIHHEHLTSHCACKVSFRTRRQKLQTLILSQFKGHLFILTRPEHPIKPVDRGLKPGPEPLKMFTFT